MKVAWLSPFNKKSAIGNYSKLATNALSKFFNIDIWVSKREEDIIETNLKVITYSPHEPMIDKLKEYDLVFYNMGDYLSYHQDIYEVSKKIKGIIILHDFIMHNFFYGYYYIHKQNLDLYFNEMERLYGVNGKQIALETNEGKRRHVCESDEVMNFPFFDAAIEGSLGVITHSHFLAERVREKYSEPVKAVYFPFEYESIKKNVHPLNNKVMLLSFGNINRNKRIDKVIEVIGENREISSKVEYYIIGSGSDIAYLEEINTKIESYNLQGIVKHLGYQENDVLNDYMSKANIFVNLRVPAMEGASWSLLEQLYYGKPVIVADNGFYSEIPDNCVVKVSIKKEKEDLEVALKKLINNEELGKEVGGAGEAFAKTAFTSEKYANEIIRISEIIAGRKPIVNFIDHVASEMNLLGINRSMDAVKKVSMEISKIIK